MDGRTNNGGKRNGSGRKGKADELELIERLKPLDDIAFKKLGELLQKGDQQALKLFMSYRFGQPRQTIDANLTGELAITWNETKNYEKKEGL